MINENRLNLFDWSTILFLLLLGLLTIIKFAISEILVINFFTISGSILIYLLVREAPRNKVAIIFRRFYIVPLLPLIFSFLHYLVPRIHTDFFDLILIEIDYFLFKTHPVFIFQKLYHPFLAAICQIAYATFYFLPFPLAIHYLKKKDMPGFYFYAFVLVSAFYISYIGYFVFPAIGPRVFLNDFFTINQHYSGLVFHVQKVLNHLENIQFDAFPSGHTLITLLIIFMNFKEKSEFRYILLVLGIFLIFATVYFQYHYVVDVLAGAMLAVILYYLFQPLRKYFQD